MHSQDAQQHSGATRCFLSNPLYTSPLRNFPSHDAGHQLSRKLIPPRCGPQGVHSPSRPWGLLTQNHLRTTLPTAASKINTELIPTELRITSVSVSVLQKILIYNPILYLYYGGNQNTTCRGPQIKNDTNNTERVPNLYLYLQIINSRASQISSLYFSDRTILHSRNCYVGNRSATATADHLLTTF